DISALEQLEAAAIEAAIARPCLDQARLVVLRKRTKEFDVVGAWKIERAHEQEANVRPLNRLMQRKRGILPLISFHTKLCDLDRVVDLLQPLLKIAGRHL